MYHLREIISETLFCLVKLSAFPLGHLVDFFHRNERKELQTFDDIGILDISPVLIEVIRRGLVRIKPYGTADGLTHLLTLRVCEQCDGQRIGILTKLLTNELCAGQHI